ncbi:hypothetical protein Sfulv_15440 [Streptomyces fulvorobeus]|uniref:Uncharacterized protein n=1 Tax=Streptomyces fulvorobeus TaxID=284028 RepID=A0A7J0C473_9ACTN|nr:hypothetical protein Sfulv_15440 [Streptomyces fulvorobeus]
MQVHVVRVGGEPVAALGGLHRRPAEHPSEPRHESLEGAHRVRRRIAVPHLVDERGGPHGAARAQGQDGQQGTQPRPAEGDGRTVGAKGPGGSEDAVAHPPIVREHRRPPHRARAVPRPRGARPDALVRGTGAPAPLVADVSRRTVGARRIPSSHQESHR